jgi:hypothetical protein
MSLQCSLIQDFVSDMQKDIKTEWLQMNMANEQKCIFKKYQEIVLY